MAVSSQAQASQPCVGCRPGVAAAAYQPGRSIGLGAHAPHDDELAVKSERIRELQRELAATLDERDALLAQLEILEQLAVPQ